ATQGRWSLLRCVGTTHPTRISNRTATSEKSNDGLRVCGSRSWRGSPVRTAVKITRRGSGGGGTVRPGADRAQRRHRAVPERGPPAAAAAGAAAAPRGGRDDGRAGRRGASAAASAIGQ